MHVQAITTKYLGPTNSRPGRVKATAYAGSVVVEWDHGKSSTQNHNTAAKKLAEKFGWGGTWCSGGMPGAGSVYVNVQALTPVGVRGTDGLDVDADEYIQAAFRTTQRDVTK